MLKMGRIKTYHQEHGFGFIKLDFLLEHDSKDLFFYIKDFPKNGLPQISEKLSFNVV